MTYYSNRNRYAYVSAWSGEEHCIIVIYVVICYGLISLYSNNRKKKQTTWSTNIFSLQLSYEYI